MNPLHLGRNVRAFNRLRHIARVLTHHGFGHAVARLNLGRFVPLWMFRKHPEDTAAVPRASSIGRRLRLVFEELGPTFVKLGQMLSTRPDLLPADVREELRSLQDHVPPFDNASAMEIISTDLGKPIGECFAWISDEPMASASIGQAYRARLPNNQEVVIKVRRPDIEQTIATDMQLIHWLAESLASLMPESRIYRPVMIVEEFDQALARELDYINEGATTDRFAKAFADDAGIRIPKVFWDYTSPRVLTIESLPGFNIDELLAASPVGKTTGALESPDGRWIDRRAVARHLADCFLKQAFEVGSFHADPHPGNILIEPVATVGLIDFGQVGTITEEWMLQLVVMVYAAVNREVDVIIDAMADLGAIGQNTDRRNLHRTLQSLLGKYDGLPVKRFDIGVLLEEFSDILRRHDVSMPRDTIMLIKAFSTASTVIARLDPELDLLELVKPRLQKTLRERFSPRSLSREIVRTSWHLMNILRVAPAQLRRSLRKLGTGEWRLDVRHENIDRLINELDRSSNRLSFAVVIAAIIVGSSVVVSANTNFMIFGIKFQYLGIIGYLFAGVLGLGLSWAIFRSGRLH